MAHADRFAANIKNRVKQGGLGTPMRKVKEYAVLSWDESKVVEELKWGDLGLRTGGITKFLGRSEYPSIAKSDYDERVALEKVRASELKARQRAYEDFGSF